MEIVKWICFWIIFAAGVGVALIGVGMLFDALLKRYMVYKEIWDGFLEYMATKVRNEKQKKNTE